VISTRDLSKLPDIDELRRLMQSLAVLDAILMPEWQYRLFSFNSKWSKGEQMGSMRDGQGDDLFAHFTQAGCFIKGFDHEADMSPKRVWPGVLDSVPNAFAKSLREPAFSMEDTTFCVWRLTGEPAWSRGDIVFPIGEDPDGSCWLLSYYDGNPATYSKYAADYFRKDVPLWVIRAVYAHQPLTAEMVEELNPEVTLKGLAADLTEIGYPAK
jgi:hypothetical protein